VSAVFKKGFYLRLGLQTLSLLVRRFLIHLFATGFVASWFCLPVFGQPELTSPQFTRLSTHQGLAQDTVQDILIDEDGFVWFATEGGLSRWDGYHFTTISGPDDVFVNASIEALFLDASSRLWISTFAAGVFTLDLTTQSITRVVYQNALSTPSWVQTAQAFAQSGNGRMYVALDHEVIYFESNTTTPHTLFTLPPAMRASEDIIRDIWVGPQFLYVATSAGFFATPLVHSDEPVMAIDYLADIPANSLNQNTKHLLVDSHRRLWLSTVQGLFSIPLENLQRALVAGRVPEFTPVLPDINVWQMIETEPGEFWLAASQGLFSLSQSATQQWQTVHLLEPNSGEVQLAKKAILAIAQDVGGNLWLGTELGGALYWSPETMTINTIQNQRGDAEPVLTDNTVWRFYQSDPDTLWVGTANGLTRLNLTTLQSTMHLQAGTALSSTPSANGVSADATNVISEEGAEITNILPAPDNTLYVESFTGIRQFNPLTDTLSVLPTNNTADEAILRDWGYGMALDTQDRLYFLADDFFRYDPATRALTVLPLSEQGLSPQLAVEFLGTSAKLDGKMLLATFDALWWLDPATLKAEKLYAYQPQEKNNSVAISSWAVDDFNTLWLGFPRFGLLGIDLHTRQVIHRYNTDNLLSTDVVYGVTTDTANNIWYSSHQGVFRFSPQNKLIKNYSYGKELSVSEFNEGAALRLADGKIAFGSTRGAVIFDPLSVIASDQAGRVRRPMAITQVELASRALSLPLTNLNAYHLNLEHDDFGIKIGFSPMLSEAAGRGNYSYTLSRAGQVVSQGSSANGLASFAFLSPGAYRFEVEPAIAHYNYDISPAYITFNIAYPPFRSPFAYAMYVMGTLILVFIYYTHRHQQLRKHANTERQLRLMGEAFRQTRDWVVVFDRWRKPIAANPAFCTIFGLNAHQALPQQWSKLTQQRPELIDNLQSTLQTLEAGAFWKQETSLSGIDGQQFDVLVDVTAVAGRAVARQQPSHEIDHYLVVISDISEQKRAERKLQKLASYDSLTGLVNRSLLLDRLDHALAHAKSHNTTVAVLFVDLDRFKGINDTLGHDYGDKLLRVVASRMQNLASRDDTVARLGGDEFVIVLEDVSHPDTINSFVGQLIDAVETPITLGEEFISTSCSVGIAFYPGDASAPAELLKQADVAMYSAKKDKVNRFTYYTAELNARAIEQLKLENSVKLAYQENRFVNHYQPIMNCLTGLPEGVELLLRCNMSEPLYPDQFIPVLEQLRYIVEVTRLAIIRTLDDLSRWRQAGFTGYVAINISALQFRSELDLPLLQKAMAQRNLPASSIRFEITEGALMDDSQVVNEQLKRFRQAGFKFALDDFGTGYSSLSYLKRFPLDVLKIDRSFIVGVGVDQQADALVHTSIQLARTFGMECVAEGVETPDQAQCMEQLGCYLHQGYLYARPLPAAHIDQLFSTINWPLQPAHH